MPLLFILPDLLSVEAKLNYYSWKQCHSRRAKRTRLLFSSEYFTSNGYHCSVYQEALSQKVCIFMLLASNSNFWNHCDQLYKFTCSLMHIEYSMCSIVTVNVVNLITPWDTILSAFYCAFLIPITFRGHHVATDDVCCGAELFHRSWCGFVRAIALADKETATRVESVPNDGFREWGGKVWLGAGARADSRAQRLSRGKAEIRAVVNVRAKSSRQAVKWPHSFHQASLPIAESKRKIHLEEGRKKDMPKIHLKLNSMEFYLFAICL